MMKTFVAMLFATAAVVVAAETPIGASVGAAVPASESSPQVVDPAKPPSVVERVAVDTNENAKGDPYALEHGYPGDRGDNEWYHHWHHRPWHHRHHRPWHHWHHHPWHHWHHHHRHHGHYWD
ncbi:Aste57867_11719 [Aphanomyces stellatus]|uniref:Aste57867_11719 protein n=1 Tax=Aphanomyces stellatus TaxID=120398 RepID=A0A485KTR3_9STRA|nr:hypothetical protein As57867_011676 [Aphanomyces stellatus]VFT88576.1 Aste57867_11719 [Aphanomyces stellatus]